MNCDYEVSKTVLIVLDVREKEVKQFSESAFQNIRTCLHSIALEQTNKTYLTETVNPYLDFFPNTPQNEEQSPRCTVSFAFHQMFG